MCYKEICKCNICLKRTAVGVITQTALVTQIVKYKYVFGQGATADEITLANRGQRLNIRPTVARRVYM